MSIKPLCSTGEYPQIYDIKPNTYYGKILTNSFAGKASEFSAIGQYIYHNIVLRDEHPDISKTLQAIAICEMHHLKLLGNLMTSLGVLPKYFYYSGFGMHSQCWNGSFVNYGKSIEEMIKFDIESEEKAITQYHETIDLIKDCQINKLIEHIIEDEKLHLTALNEIMISLSK